MRASLTMIPSLALAASALHLNVTAIGAKNGQSTLECWQMDSPIDISTQPGTIGTALTSLGSVANLSYSALPAQYDAGLHTAPMNQWVAFMSGLAYITLPNDTSVSAYVTGGEFGSLIFAADTADVSEIGHRTEYPGTTETTALQIPTEDGEVPGHSILHLGPCTPEEVNGLEGLTVS